MKDAEILRWRINRFMSESGVPKAAFCRKVGITASALRKWELGEFKFKPSTTARIDGHLKSFNR